MQPITREDSSRSISEQVEAFCKGGIRWVQLRVKKASEAEFRQLALRARDITTRYGVTLILDDRVDMVHEVEADGVHLGENDMAPEEARSLLGDSILIGGTADRFERVEQLASTTDYIGCGPFRNTSTKEALSPILGLDGYREIMEKMEERRVKAPLLAIGGIGKDDIPELLQIGVYGVAVSSSITEANDPVGETEAFIEALDPT